MAKNIRKQAITLLESISQGKVTVGKKEKKEVNELTDEGKAFIVSLVRGVGEISGFKVEDKTTDDEILKHFKKSLVADLAEAMLDSIKTDVRDVLTSEMSELEKEYGVQKASEIRSAVEVVIEDIVVNMHDMMSLRDEKEMTFKLLAAVEKLGIQPADVTVFNISSPYYEQTKNFNARQMINYLEANSAI